MSIEDELERVATVLRLARQQAAVPQARAALANTHS